MLFTILAIVCFVIAAFITTATHGIALVPLGLAFLAIGLLVPAIPLRVTRGA